MKNQCYICQQNFDTKERLFDHLDVHARLKSQKPKTEDPKAQEPKTEDPKAQGPIAQEPKIKRKGNPAICSDCGSETVVPFKPKKGRPVYCQECLMVHRTNRLKDLANEVSLENN